MCQGNWIYIYPTDGKSIETVTVVIIMLRAIMANCAIIDEVNSDRDGSIKIPYHILTLSINVYLYLNLFLVSIFT